MFRAFSQARPVVWVVGNALLTGTLSAHWVDVTTAAPTPVVDRGVSVKVSHEHPPAF